MIPDSITRTRFVVATLLGLLGLAINCTPLPLFANIQLVMGNALVLLCVSRLGLGYALWCGALAMTGLYITWGHPFGYLTCGLELLVVWHLRRRGWFLLYADVVYWLLVGMPLAFLLMVNVGDIPNELLLFAVLKQGFNGVLYTAVAAMLGLVMPQGWFRRLRQQPVMFRSFRDKLVHGVVVLIALVMMTSMLMASHHLMLTQKQLLRNNMSSTGQQLSEALEHYLVDHDKVVTNLAWLLSATNGLVEGSLADFQRQYPEMVRLSLSDNEGLVRYSKGELPLVAGDPLSNRDSFYQASTFLKTFRSEAFELDGRVMVAIAAPVYGDDKLTGVLEGMLDLGQVALKRDPAHELQFVLTDRYHRVVNASPELGILPLAGFVYRIIRNGNEIVLPVMSVGNIHNPVGDHFYYPRELDNGWYLYVMAPYEPVIQRLERYFLWALLMALAGMLVSILLARMLGAYLTAPLEALALALSRRHSSEQRLAPLGGLPRGSALEIQMLYDELENNRHAMEQHHLELEDKVATRTAQLEVANQQLAQLAHRDGLTGCYNRRYFDHQFDHVRQHCARSGGHLALAMIDIDHFKRVNDEHGHLVGDDCLKRLVGLIRGQFSRKIDLVARFGGEEFILLLPEVDTREVVDRLERLRQQVARTPIAVDEQGSPLYITISIGLLVVKPDFSADPVRWIQAADAQLYRAKSSGRNRLCVQPTDGVQELA